MPWVSTSLPVDFFILTNPAMRAEPSEWANVLAQAILHIAMGHVDPRRQDRAWRIAADFEALAFLRSMAIGRRPGDLPYPERDLPGKDLETRANLIAEEIRDGRDVPETRSIAGGREPVWIYQKSLPPFDAATKQALSEALAIAIRASVASAIASAGAAVRTSGIRRANSNSMAELARSWFIANFPLLAALAAAFEIVEDAATCNSLAIRFAAVEPEARRIYINPQVRWTEASLRFVMAHELLHVGLAHAARRQGRNPFLWNVACDYVINGWLMDMGVGTPPIADLLLDGSLGFERDSAEAVYDRIVRDFRLMRRSNKLVTLRGAGQPDLLSDRPPAWWHGQGADLDTFYRRALAEGLDLHLTQPSRGLLPAGLVEEVRAIQQPPIPWDVKLGQWLDAFFPPFERRRSFHRASRRQSSTPDIPRAVYVSPPEILVTRTFGVVLDTSGSMTSGVLGRGLGAIASYAESRDVPLVRVVQCDARVHDMGFVEPQRLLETVEVRGRGGTVIMPAVQHLIGAHDFPKDAPILIITDGECDDLEVPREHAFLMPEGCRLPFFTRAPIFHFEGGSGA